MELSGINIMSLIETDKEMPSTKNFDVRRHGPKSPIFRPRQKFSASSVILPSPLPPPHKSPTTTHPTSSVSTLRKWQADA